MTRDVFKYFTHVRSLKRIYNFREGTRAWLLRIPEPRGVWLDPQTGKRYRARNKGLKRFLRRKKEKWCFSTDPQTLAQFQQSGGDKEKKPEKKKEPQQQVTPLPQIPDGVSDDEFAAASKGMDWWS